MDIPPPKTTLDHFDHVLECQFAIEPFLHELAAKAEAVGWQSEVVATALGGLIGARFDSLLNGDHASAEIKKRGSGH